MNENPHNDSTTHSEDHIERQQEIQLQEEELRLRQEERRINNVRRTVMINRLLRGMFFLVAALESLLALRFILKLAGANPDNLFAQVIYGWSNPFIYPFNNLFGEPAVSGNIIEFNTIAAMIIYGLLGTLGTRLVEIIGDR
ncbi:YggT family protein [Crocosphaera sp. UHCC 0190]|uniref:YggT family protein n=1 Tax=Crocosphaera sp. UHCC 0190 TaxID=3110246 RepID=UPI002B1FB269|nr:YggT family protein [Crocosphaera sp. UHCC 0190]MEA5511169.1 YggT family protein [Crocosphaera sp. UHCC 0190]